MAWLGLYSRGWSVFGMLIAPLFGLLGLILMMSRQAWGEELFRWERLDGKRWLSIIAVLCAIGAGLILVHTVSEEDLHRWANSRYGPAVTLVLFVALPLVMGYGQESRGRRRKDGGCGAEG